jgi:tRNA wybutosine-synthesizing protein 2
MTRAPVLEVPAADAERALRALQRRGLLDGARRIRREGDVVLLPALDDPALAEVAAELGARLVAEALAPREGRPVPHEQVVARLQETLPAGLAALAPARWEQHGDVLVLRLPDALLPHGEAVARAYADVLGLRAVLHDPEGVRGELREMHARLLLGDDPVATHVENGVRYRFDASRVMFSSGNVHERMRVARLPLRGETVVDMFAGIGYFTLPLALHARPARIHALEKNPVSHRYLVENVRLNGVEDVVEPWLGDNRDFPQERLAHRVMMGYFPGTQAFLPKALRLLRPEGGILHYHNTAHAERWTEELTSQVFDAAMDRGWAAEVLEARVVKTHSPGVVHAVLAARVEPGG